jgi:DNA-binding CsgD family transcriptional regulator
MLEALSAAFDQLGLAIVILSTSGGILLANDLARAMIENGGPIRVVDGRLQAKDYAANAELMRAIAALAQPGFEGREHHLCLARASEHEQAALGCLRPLAITDGQAAALALFIADPSQSNHYAIEALGRAYGLSKAETRTLRALAETDGIPDAAARLQITVATVKSHLRKIFRKTKTSRQVDLVRLVECCRTPFRRLEEPEKQKLTKRQKTK